MKKGLFSTPCVTQQGLYNALFRCNVDSDLCIRQPLFFYTWCPAITFSKFEDFKSIIHRLCILACFVF